jgi:hypothetical protein
MYIEFPKLFKELDEKETEQYREFARTHVPEDLKKWELYHPVCREEWIKMGITPNRVDPGRFNNLLE